MRTMHTCARFLRQARIYYTGRCQTEEIDQGCKKPFEQAALSGTRVEVLLSEPHRIDGRSVDLNRGVFKYLDKVLE